MSKYSPTVLPDYGGHVNIGDELANAFEEYQQTKLREKAIREHDQDRAHMLESQALADAIAQSHARSQGIMHGTAPHENLDLEVPSTDMPSKLPWDEISRPAPPVWGEQQRGGGLEDALRGQFDRTSGMQGNRSSLPTPSGFNPRAAGPLPMRKEQAGDRLAADAPSIAGAFNMGTMDFHSPLADRANASAAAASPGATRLHLQGNYEQLTPDYYEDRSAEGPRGRALAAEMARQQHEATVRHLDAQTAALYGPKAPVPGTPEYLDLQDALAAIRVRYRPVPRDPVATHRANRQYDIENPLPQRDNPNAITPQERRARSSAAVSRQDATAFDRRAGGFEQPLNNPMRRMADDTTDFSALRDSVRTYRGKADSARAAATRYNREANQAAGLADVLPAPVLPPSTDDYSDVQSGASTRIAPTPSGTTQLDARGVRRVAPTPPSAAAPTSLFTRQQIDGFYQDALKRGADPAKARARRDSLLRSVSP